MKDRIKQLIKIALEEDLMEAGDITSKSIFTDETGDYILISKDNGVLCGRDAFEMVFHFIDKNIKVDFKFKDGDKIAKGDLIATVSGKIKNILTGERTALNFISHLSGIATKTSNFVSEGGGKTKILDTRKTLPGMRLLHKYAVKCGGGFNHRMGLYDMVMIKDTHIDGTGSISLAVEKVKEKLGNKYKIEVEARNLDEVKEALACNVDIIMLDNMDNYTMKEAVKIINKKTETEASGNMSLNRISGVSKTGVDYISAGELTHSVKAFDFSLRKKK